MNSKEACKEWARIVRAVADGEMSPAEGRAKRPEVADETSVPSAFWSVSWILELEAGDRQSMQEIGMQESDYMASEFAEKLRTLADRIEGIERIP